MHNLLTNNATLESNEIFDIQSPQKVWNILEIIIYFCSYLEMHEVYRIVYPYKACSAL